MSSLSVQCTVAVAEYVLDVMHDIDWQKVQVVDCHPHYRQRCTCIGPKCLNRTLDCPFDSWLVCLREKTIANTAVCQYVYVNVHM